MENLDGALGRRLRERRKSRGLSLQQIADQVGISVGHLSQIERGMSSPSVRDLIRIAEILQTSAGELLDLFEEPSRDRIVVRHAQRPAVALKNGITKLLLTPHEEAPLKMFMVTLAPGSTTGDELYAHEGIEAGLVLEGRIRLIVEHREMLVGQGDSFRFTSDRPHRFMNAHDGESQVLWVNCSMLPVHLV
ncbi:helix-turn-helix domain-containing protein [Gluconacetobacter tumulisoli]|uniref:Helix-turn-helix domain-containing protein n=1 Tax=Gluconacetobacter tumulisoli TaxID=1286189 RepID=A0A7W4PLK9_9PROT|nr:helix-turn-helix domain-containing protein [Gluconacetobacter tumulisoli]MBB2201968.1 helix-turn-helix domain-containing protein [Gluconacetobacter tumulisoli]